MKEQLILAKVKLGAVLYIVVNLLVYLCIAFYKLDLNFMNWDRSDRFIMIMCGFLFPLFIIILYVSEIDDKPKP